MSRSSKGRQPVANTVGKGNNNSKKGALLLNKKSSNTITHKLPLESIIKSDSNRIGLPTRPSSSNSFIQVKKKVSNNSKKMTLNNQSKAVAAAIPGGELSISDLKPFEFLSMNYSHVSLSQKNMIATRSKCSNNVVFINRCMRPGEKICLKVLGVDAGHSSSFLLGMTTCGLAKITSIPGHLVEFCKPYFKCGGYSIHNHVNYANSIGDIIVIERLKADGSLRVRTNGKQSGIRDMTDGARFKTTRAIPFINLNLGVSSIKIVNEQDISNFHSNGIHSINSDIIVQPKQSEPMKQVQPAWSTPTSRARFEQSSPFGNGGDVTMDGSPKSSKPQPPPGFEAKPSANRGVPFTEHSFGLDLLRTPSPAVSLNTENENIKLLNDLKRRMSYSELFHPPHKIIDDHKAIRRPSSEVKESKPKRKTCNSGLCDIFLKNSGDSPLQVGHHFEDIKIYKNVGKMDKWATSDTIFKRDANTLERKESYQLSGTTGFVTHDPFYAFLKQPLEPNMRLTFKIKKSIEINIDQRTTYCGESKNSMDTLSFGMTNMKMTNGDMDRLPVNPLDLTNRLYEEWFISTNFLTEALVGTVFSIERNRDGEVFVCLESASGPKDWFENAADDQLLRRKAIFNVFYCTEYYFFLNFRGIISSIELLGHSKLSEEYNNNNISIMPLDVALSSVNLAAGKCISCKGAEVEWAPDDCSHRSYCESCAKKLAQKQSGCLICGSLVSAVSRIFI